MAIKGLRKSATFQYVSRNDPNRSKDGSPLEGATIFTIGTLDGYEHAEVKDLQTEARLVQHRTETGELRSAVDTKMVIYKGALMACRYGLKGWINFMDDDGKPIPYTTSKVTVGNREVDVLSEDALAQIPPDLAMELMQEITSRNLPSKVDVGNSDAQS